MDTFNRKGKFRRSSIVYSNDPQKPRVDISIGCFVKQYITLGPIGYGNLIGFEGDELKSEVTITSFLSHPVNITEVTSDIDDKIKWKLITEESGKKYVLDIRNKVTEADTFQGKIVLTTDSKKKPQIEFTLFCRLQKEMIVKPESLSFGTIDTTDKDFDAVKLSRKIILSDIRKEGLVVNKINVSTDWIETENKKRNKDYIIIITLDKNKLPKGKFEEEIYIHTSYKEKPLVVSTNGKVI